jgi:hypothetical protein
MTVEGPVTLPTRRGGGGCTGNRTCQAGEKPASGRPHSGTRQGIRQTTVWIMRAGCLAKARPAAKTTPVVSPPAWKHSIPNRSPRRQGQAPLLRPRRPGEQQMGCQKRSLRRSTSPGAATGSHGRRTTARRTGKWQRSSPTPKRWSPAGSQLGLLDPGPQKGHGRIEHRVVKATDCLDRFEAPEHKHWLGLPSLVEITSSRSLKGVTSPQGTLKQTEIRQGGPADREGS